MSIVITGATGQLGRHVVEALLQRNVPAAEIVATGRSLEKLADFSARGVQVKPMDYSDAASVAKALQGASKVLLISGSEVGQRVDQHRTVIEAAKAEGVELVAYTSIANADTTAMKLAAEHPDRVSALVLANSAGFGKEVALVLRLLAVGPPAALLLRPAPVASRRTVQSIFYDKALVTDARVDHAFALSQRASHRQTLLDVARDLGTIFGVRAGWRRALLGALAQSETPTLVVWGDHDHILPFSHLEAAVAALQIGRASCRERVL